MPTIVGILTFMSRINFLLSRVEYEKSFMTLGPVVAASMNYQGYTKNVKSTEHESHHAHKC